MVVIGTELAATDVLIEPTLVVSVMELLVIAIIRVEVTTFTPFPGGILQPVKECN